MSFHEIWREKRIYEEARRDRKPGKGRKYGRTSGKGEAKKILQTVYGYQHVITRPLL